MQPATTAAPDKVWGDLQHLELARLDAHPLNPRLRMTKASLASLVSSITTLGVLEPLLVRPADALGQDVQPHEARRYQVVSGHRRLEALRLLERDVAPCIVRPMTDAEALEALLTGNEHREEVDPLREAEGLDALVKLLGGDVALAGERLGKGARWLASRRALLNLSPAWRERAAKEPWRSWPVAVLETLARVAPDAQDALTEAHRYELLDAEHAPRAAAVERWVDDSTRELKRAPWNLEDPDLVVAAGRCTTCPKTSTACPGLFDDGTPDPKHARCLDATCWARKASAHVAREHGRLEDKLGTKVVQVVPAGTAATGEAARLGKGVLQPWQYDAAKKGQKGAVPAQVVTGKGATVTWVKLRRGRPAAKPENVAKRPAPTLKELEASYQQQVEEEAGRNLREAVSAKAFNPEPLKVLQGSLLVGMLQPYPANPGKRLKAAQDLPALDATRLEVWARYAWPMVVEALRDTEDEQVAQLAGMVGLEVKAAREAAMTAVKPGKALLAARAAKAKPKKEPKAKKPPKDLTQAQRKDRIQKMLKGRGQAAKPGKGKLRPEDVLTCLELVLPEGNGRPDLEVVKLWTAKELAEVRRWAAAVHLSASDNPVAVPAAPLVVLAHYADAGVPFPLPKKAKPAPTEEEGQAGIGDADEEP